MERESTAPNADRIAALEAKVASLEAFENATVERLIGLGNVVYEHEDSINELQEQMEENSEAHKNLHRRIQNRKVTIKALTARLARLEVRVRR